MNFSAALTQRRVGPVPRGAGGPLFSLQTNSV
jgi:hypothetical protein